MVTVFLIDSNIKIFIDMFAVANFSLGYQTLIDGQVRLNPNIAVNDCSVKLYLGRQGSCILGHICYYAYTFKVVVWLAEYHYDISDVIDVVLPEREKFISFSWYILSNRLQISVENMLMLMILNSQNMIIPVVFSAFLQNPIFLMTKFKLVLPRSDIYSSEIGIGGFIQLHFMWFFPIIPTSKKLALFFAFVLDEEGLEFRSIVDWRIAVWLTVELSHFCYIYFFGEELVESFGSACKCSQEGYEDCHWCLQIDFLLGYVGLIVMG